MDWLNESVWIGGAVIVAAVALQAVWLTFDAVRRTVHDRRQQRREDELLAWRIAAARTQWERQQKRLLQWQGWRKFELAHKILEDENDEQYSYYVRPHDRKPIPGFYPGQYITFKVTPPGETAPTVRCYSLSDAPREGYYRVTVKRVGPPRDRPELPPGKMSNYLADRVEEGDTLDVQAPKGEFYLDPSADTEKPVVLIGGGIGMTPVMTMLHTIVESPGQREVWFFYGVRNGADHIFKADLEKVARENPNVRLHVCYSRPRDGEQQGRDYHHAERVTVDLLKRLLPSNNYEFYVCGPPAMMDTLPADLREWGVSKKRIHTESFGPSSSDHQVKELDPSKADGPTVTFRKSGVSIPWNSEAGDLLQLAMAHEVPIQSGCCQGDCGTCLVSLLSGEVEYTTDPGFDCEEGTCLTCCCVPKTAVELDA